MKTITFLFLILIFFSCKEELSIKGYYIDNKYYEVISYGKSPESVTNKVKSRNMAKEAALIYAQKKVEEDLGNSSYTWNSGIIIKTIFYDNHTCKLIYRVKLKKRD